MNAQRADYDAIVIGGGPAGSTAAGFLAQAGRRVLLFEKEHFPRYHIGESLLSATLPILEALGVMPAIEQAGFIRKPGGSFVWGRDAEPWSFFFREDPGGYPHAYHVVRSEFDHILLRHAAASGVEVREGWRVREITNGEAVRISAEDAAGARMNVEASYLIDASGQQAVLGHRDRLREFNAFFKNLAIFGYFRDAEPLTGNIAGNILSAAFADGWCWFIPLHNGTTSVGAVIDAERFAGRAARDAGELYSQLVAACTPVAARLRNATLCSPVRIIRDYSYSSRRFYGPRYLLAGDAACFIDPVFSTGVHLACLSGFLAAQTIDAILDGGDEAAEQRRYDARYRSVFERYLEFLYFFYDHHSDPESYFWAARRVLNPESDLDHRAAFVRLMSGGGDLRPESPELREALSAQHSRMSAATRRGRFAALPIASLFRVKQTVTEMAAAKYAAPTTRVETAEAAPGGEPSLRAKSRH